MHEKVPTVYSSEDEEVIKKRLRNLGYLWDKLTEYAPVSVLILCAHIRSFRLHEPKEKAGIREMKLTQRLSMYMGKSNVVLGVKIISIIVPSIMFFGQDLTIVFNDALQSEITSYTLVVPLIFTYLVYRKRKMLRAIVPLEGQGYTKKTKHIPTIAGILLFVTAILLYWYGSYTFTPLEYHVSSFPIFVTGLILILFNLPTFRQLVFPIAFLIFMTPPPSEILYGLGATLSVISSEVSNAIVGALGVPSTLSSEYGNPTILITRPNGATMSFAVDIACSGVYSLIGFLIFAVFIAYIMRDKLWKKLTLFLFGIPLIYLLNVVRITAILLIGYHYGEQTALQVFHLLGGWALIFLGTLLLLAISEKIFKIQIFTKFSEKCMACNPKIETKQDFCLSCGKILKATPSKLSKSNLIKIAAVILSIVLIMSIQAPVFALTQSPGTVIINTPSGQEVSTEILPEISGYNLDFIYRDTSFEAMAKQDMSLIYLYTPLNQPNAPMWVAIEIASTRSSLHKWETCLITWPMTHGRLPRVKQIELKDVQLVENPPILGRYFVFQYQATNETQAVLYWFETATFAVNATSQQKHVKISLIVYPDNPENLTSIENRLQVSAKAIANYWQPIKTWSQIALFLSQNGDKLVTLTTGMLVGIVIFYIFDRRKERKTNFHAYKKLSTPSKQIIDATHETEKISIPTLNNIATTYQNKTGQTINKEKLLQELSSIEKTGTLKRVIVNKNDEPTVVWKTQMSFKQNT